MDEKTKLAAYATIELVVYQIADSSLTQEHRDKLAVIMKDVDPQMVALEIATVLAGVAVGYHVPLGSILEEMRRRALDAG